MSLPFPTTKVAGFGSAILLGFYVGYGLSRPIRLSPPQSPPPSRLSETNKNSNQRELQGLEPRSNQNHNVDTRLTKAAVIRNRILKTFAYLTSSVGITGISALLFYKFGFAQKTLVNMTKHPTLYVISLLLTSTVLLFATRFTSYQKRTKLKHLFWILMHINEGCMLSVLGFLGGKRILKALLLTANILIGISLLSSVSYSYTSKWIRKMGAYLGVALGFLCGLSMVESVWFGSDSKRELLSNINVIVSLVVFGFKMAYDTQRVIRNAEEKTAMEYELANANANARRGQSRRSGGSEESAIKEYDPINEQIDLYLNSLNFFIEIVKLLIKLEMQKKKTQQQRADGDADEEDANH